LICHEPSRAATNFFPGIVPQLRPFLHFAPAVVIAFLTLYQKTNPR
jgi:hypothetical protein